MTTSLYILIVFLLVVANGFFVASEFALVGVRRSRVETLAASGSGSARRLLGLLDNLNAYISATQLGITMASLALGWIGEPVVAHMLEAPLKGRVSEAALHTISFAVERTERLRIRRVRFTPAVEDAREPRQGAAALLPFAGAAQVVTQAGC